MGKNTSYQRKQTAKLVLVCTGVFLLIAALSFLCMPFFDHLADPDFQEKLRNWIASLGFGGWLCFLLLQILQIVIAFIPGEPVQLLSGLLYGTLGGLLTCLLGSLIASTGVFFAVRKLGDKLVIRLFGKNKLNEYAFLRDSEKIETVTFILFLLPGMPKDLLTYLAGITRIDPWKFLAISTIARIPALTASTLMGSSVGQGNFMMTLVVVIVAVLGALVGVIYRHRLMDFIHRHGKTKH